MREVLQRLDIDNRNVHVDIINHSPRDGRNTTVPANIYNLNVD
jgi:hypothetical protein